VTKEKVTRFSVSLPPDLLAQFDRHVADKAYATRSKALADLMRDALQRDEWEDDRVEVLGAVTLVYDHHTRGITERLTEIQHDFHDQIVSTTHVHIDHDRCLEIILLRGPIRDVRRVGDHLTSARGVLHGKTLFVATKQGEE
jgi:CopG family nickel-responsive transcriptional regulator